MSSVTRSVATGARGKRHNRSGLFTRIIFAVNILIRSLGAAEKAADDFLYTAAGQRNRKSYRAFCPV